MNPGAFLMTANPAYTGAQIALHWITALLIAMNFLIGDRMEAAYEAALKAGTVGGPKPHAIIGVLVLILVLARMAIKRRRGAPAPLAGETPLMHRAALLGHLAIYGVVILTVLSGIATWGIGLEGAAQPHETLTTVLMLLIFGHAAMALVHHFVMKDGAFMRMLRPSA